MDVKVHTVKEIIYVRRIVKSTEYSSHGDWAGYEFTNGSFALISPAGHSDKNNFPDGSDVVCKMVRSGGKYVLESLVLVLACDSAGQPVKFSSGRRNFSGPNKHEEILDERGLEKIISGRPTKPKMLKELQKALK